MGSDLVVTSPRFSVNLPNDPEIFGSYVRRAEELGFHQAWTWDTVNTVNPTLDGLHRLSYAAAVTERIRLGIAVLYSGRRNPAMAARELATIDQLSGGRLTAGVGLGNAHYRPMLESLGMPMDRPIRRLIEGVEVMRALWSSEEATYEGEIFSFSGMRSEPKPVQQPGPPIVFGARSEPAVRRAVKYGDGFSCGPQLSDEEFVRLHEVIRAELDEQQRDPDEFAVSKGVFVAVEQSRDLARRRIEPMFERSYGSSPVYTAEGMAERVAVFGTVEDCAEQLTRLMDDGVDELMLCPVYDPMEQLDALGSVAALLGQEAVDVRTVRT